MWGCGDVGRNKRSAVQAIASHSFVLPELRFACSGLRQFLKCFGPSLVAIHAEALRLGVAISSFSSPSPGSLFLESGFA